MSAVAPTYFRPLRFGQTEQLLVALDVSCLAFVLRLSCSLQTGQELDVELGELDGWLEAQVDHLSEVSIFLCIIHK